MKTEFINMKGLFKNSSTEKTHQKEDLINDAYSQFNENYNQLVANFKASLAH